MKKIMNMKHECAVPFSDDQLSRMVEMYASGYSARRLSAIYGIGQSSVLRRLHAMGVPVRKLGSRAQCDRLRAASK